jgi:glycosyltransferase involved in cell wall biosynthesis
VPVLTLVVDQLLAPVPGGTGRYAREITAALAKRPRPGWRVRTVTAWHRDTDEARVAGADGPHRLPAGRRALAELWRRGLPPTVRGDRVHTVTPLAPPRRDGLVVAVWDTVPWTHPETLTPRGAQWHRDMVERAVRRADAIVVSSRAVAEQLQALFPQAKARVEVIGLGVTPLPPPPDSAARRDRLGLPDRYVLSVATLEPRKGLDVLIRAMARPPVGAAHLVLVGPPGWGGVDVTSVAASAGLPAERLHRLGRIADEDLAAVLAGATVLAAPSRAEGFGLPALEAMAAGVPVVVSDAPALVELVDSAGVITRRDDAEGLAEALSSVFTDDALAADLAGRGLARSREFSWSAAAEKVWDLHAGPR